MLLSHLRIIFINKTINKKGFKDCISSIKKNNDPINVAPAINVTPVYGIQAVLEEAEYVTGIFLFLRYQLFTIPLFHIMYIVLSLMWLVYNMSFGWMLSTVRLRFVLFIFANTWLLYLFCLHRY